MANDLYLSRLLFEVSVLYGHAGARDVHTQDARKDNLAADVHTLDVEAHHSQVAVAQRNTLVVLHTDYTPDIGVDLMPANEDRSPEVGAEVLLWQGMILQAVVDNLHGVLEVGCNLLLANVLLLAADALPCIQC